MAAFNVSYDKRRDTLYVLKRGARATWNFVWGMDETMRFDPETYEVVGWTITNFSLRYPKLARSIGPKHRWFITDFFETRSNDLNRLLSPIRSRKALVDFLTAEAAGFSHPLHLKA